MAESDYHLSDGKGRRLYLTAAEREGFYRAIDVALAAPGDREKRTFCMLLYWTGCRISEALAVQNSNIDFSAGGVVIQTLKRRKRTHRFVPLPDAFLVKLDDVHRVKDNQRATRQAQPEELIWPMSRPTAWRAVKSVMRAAGVSGPQASPKGLRHGFVIAHQHAATPEHMIQRWLGWASRDMMAVYGRAIGQDEREIAGRLW